MGVRNASNAHVPSLVIPVHKELKNLVHLSIEPLEAVIQQPANKSKKWLPLTFWKDQEKVIKFTANRKNDEAK